MDSESDCGGLSPFVWIPRAHWLVASQNGIVEVVIWFLFGTIQDVSRHMPDYINPILLSQDPKLISGLQNYTVIAVMM